MAVDLHTSDIQSINLAAWIIASQWNQYFHGQSPLTSLKTLWKGLLKEVSQSTVVVRQTDNLQNYMAQGNRPTDWLPCLKRLQDNCLVVSYLKLFPLYQNFEVTPLIVLSSTFWTFFQLLFSLSLHYPLLFNCHNSNCIPEFFK